MQESVIRELHATVAAPKLPEVSNLLSPVYDMVS